MTTSPTSRRRFLKTAALAGVSLSTGALAQAADSDAATGSATDSAASNASANKINHASIGGNGMAKGDIRDMLGTGLVNLIAVAEVDDTRAQWLAQAHPNTTVYKDWRVLLAKEGHRLDSINVTVPDHMHAPIGITAMKQGLHVYGQKPLGHSLYETRRMAQVARETGVVTQMGTQMSSSISERLTVKMVQEGVVGKLTEIHMFSHKAWGDNDPKPDRIDPIPDTLDWDMWCGVAPKPDYIGDSHYHPRNWRKRLDYGCGTLGDMGCHIFNSMFRALGAQAPLSVTSLGDPANDHSWGLNEKYKYLFPGNDITAQDTIDVTWHGGTNLPPEHFRTQFGRFMPKQGTLFVGTEGTLVQPHERKPLLFPREKFTDYVHPEIKERNHYADFVNAVRGENVKPLADFCDFGGPLTEVVLLGGLSSRFPQQTLHWDSKNLQITNFDAANHYVKRDHRNNWHIEGLS